MAGYGPLARSIVDVAAAFEVLLGRDFRDPDSLPAGLDEGGPFALQGLRVAFFTDDGVCSPMGEIAQGVEACARLLERAGARLVERRLPRPADATEIHLGLLILDRWLISAWKEAAGTQQLHPWVQAGADYLEDAASDFDSNTATLLHDDWDAYRKEASHFIRDFDVVLGPIAPGTALPHGELSSAENYDWTSYASIYNVTGWPAAVIRGGACSRGLPFGVQIAGAPFSDRLVLQVAAYLERELGGFVPPALSP